MLKIIFIYKNCLLKLRLLNYLVYVFRFGGVIYMNRKNVQKTALTTSAVLAGMALGVSVNQNTAHADTVANSTAATSATTTDQQLANMQSAHVATESAAAASNAAV